MIEAKKTIQAMADIDTHPDAVERELDPQVWSTRQPWFAERLAALQAKITHEAVTTHGSSKSAHECYAKCLPHSCRCGLPFIHG